MNVVGRLATTGFAALLVISGRTAGNIHDPNDGSSPSPNPVAHAELESPEFVKIPARDAGKDNAAILERFFRTDGVAPKPTEQNKQALAGSPLYVRAWPEEGIYLTASFAPPQGATAQNFNIAAVDWICTASLATPVKVVGGLQWGADLTCSGNRALYNPSYMMVKLDKTVATSCSRGGPWP